MVHFINPYNRVVLQHAQGGYNPRVWLGLSDEECEEWIACTQFRSARFLHRITLERDAARARGVHIILDDTLPEHYIRVDLDD